VEWQAVGDSRELAKPFALADSSGMALTTRIRGTTIQGLLWAGPLGIGLATLLLIASAPYFRHGPGVPTAGDERAWTAMWGALGLVALGCITGSVANLAWAVVALRARRRPSRLEWFRAVVNILLGSAFAFLWFGR